MDNKTNILNGLNFIKSCNHVFSVPDFSGGERSEVIKNGKDRFKITRGTYIARYYCPICGEELIRI